MQRPWQSSGSSCPGRAWNQSSPARASKLPPGLENANEGAWNSWTRKQDKAIRARLEQGDLDSMVNLLLFGTSFTRQPRIAIENITEAARKGVLRARVDDLITGLRNPGGNERLAFLNALMRSRGFDANGVVCGSRGIRLQQSSAGTSGAERLSPRAPPKPGAMLIPFSTGRRYSATAAFRSTPASSPISRSNKLCAI